MEPSLERHELEDVVESRLLGIAQSLIPVSPGPNDLKVAKDYDPYFFGGLFPTLGLTVTRTQGASRYFDKPGRPGRLVVEVKIYQPWLAVREQRNPDEDRTKLAKRITRQIRSLFLEALAASPTGSYVEVVESRGSSRNEVGSARQDEREEQFLWIDTTELHVST